MGTAILKNRDNETALDWFEIRAMSSAQGRFQSVDPANAGASLGNPQTWNAYSYVGNNPLSNTDPSGEGILAIVGGIVGTFFGGPMGAIIGFSAGTAGEAALWGPSSNIGAGLPGVGSFTGCGGPLGNCGGFGNDPWSENPGLARVKDPGRFISDFSAITQVDNNEIFDLIRNHANVMAGLPGSKSTKLRPNPGLSFCSGGLFGYIGPHFGIPKTPLQAELLGIGGFDSHDGLLIGSLGELGAKKGSISFGYEKAFSFRNRTWNTEGLAFGKRDWTSAKIGAVSVGVLGDTKGNIGAFGGIWWGGGFYGHPSLSGCAAR